MLTQPQERRYSTQSGLRDMMIAEKEIVLTFLLQLLSERGILDRLAFKGGTCLRKMFIGNQGRFSTDLDFSGIEEHDHEDVILAMMEAFEQEFHGIRFRIPDDSAYSGASWPPIPIEVGHPFRCEVGRLFRRDVGHFFGYPGMGGQDEPGMSGQDPGIVSGI